MILYFTGTGNTKFVAEYIADHVGDECIDLGEVLKYKRPLRFNSVKPFVFCAPIYAWGYPKLIEKLISRAELTGSEQIYFISTMESQTGSFEHSLEKIAYAKDMAYMGACGVPMPNNYISGGDLPTAEEAEVKITASLPLMKTLSDRIMEGAMIEKFDDTPFAGVASGAVNYMFNRFFISSSKFEVSEDCVSCGKCETVCPVNNVKLSPTGVPHFDRYCLNCYSCVNRCPAKAINIGKKTEGRNRYVCPEYSDWKASGKITE
ncbi:MAG: EFR1 family ferrodoxin [Ruminococcus sp.]|nr:EFR1 family ferrodoxin [Ruminococcus sp.]